MTSICERTSPYWQKLSVYERNKIFKVIEGTYNVLHHICHINQGSLNKNMADQRLNQITDLYLDGLSRVCIVTLDRSQSFQILKMTCTGCLQSEWRNIYIYLKMIVQLYTPDLFNFSCLVAVLDY